MVGALSTTVLFQRSRQLGRTIQHAARFRHVGAVRLARGYEDIDVSQGDAVEPRMKHGPSGKCLGDLISCSSTAFGARVKVPLSAHAKFQMPVGGMRTGAVVCRGPSLNRPDFNPISHHSDLWPKNRSGHGPPWTGGLLSIRMKVWWVIAHAVKGRETVCAHMCPWLQRPCWCFGGHLRTSSWQ